MVGSVSARATVSRSVSGACATTLTLATPVKTIKVTIVTVNKLKCTVTGMANKMGSIWSKGTENPVIQMMLSLQAKT